MGERTVTFPALEEIYSITRGLLPGTNELICISQPGWLLTPDDVAVHLDDKKNPRSQQEHLFFFWQEEKFLTQQQS